MTLLIVIFSVLLILNVICLLGNVLFFRRGCERYQAAAKENDAALQTYENDQKILERATELFNASTLNVTAVKPEGEAH